MTAASGTWLQPLEHTVAASAARLQPPAHGCSIRRTVAASDAHGCSLWHIWLQVLHSEATVYDFELSDDMSGTRRDLGQAMALHPLPAPPRPRPAPPSRRPHPALALTALTPP